MFSKVIILCVALAAANAESVIQLNTNSASDFSYFPVSSINKFVYTVDATNDIKMHLSPILGIGVPNLMFTLHTGGSQLNIIERNDAIQSASFSNYLRAGPREIHINWNETYAGVTEADGRLLIEYKPTDGFFDVNYIGLTANAPRGTFTFNADQLFVDENNSDSSSSEEEEEEILNIKYNN